MTQACAPWTDEQVLSLNEWQACERTHPFTSLSGDVLIATRDGWIARPGGPIVQCWAHDFMADGSWRGWFAALHGR